VAAICKNFEFIKQYDFIPKFLIIPGSLYISDFSLISKEKWRSLNKYREYLGDNYATFRIYNNFKDDWFLRSAIYSKLPAIILQFDEYCEIIEFHPIIENIPLTIGLKSDNSKLLIKLFLTDIELKTKSKLHLGEWQDTKKIQAQTDKKINSNDVIKIIKYKRWYDFIFEKFEKTAENIKNNYIDKTQIIDSINLTFDFLNKLFDPVNKLHCEFIEPLSTKFTLHQQTYCLPTYEFARIYILSQFDKIQKKEYYENLIVNLLNLIYLELPELNCAITHNTIGIDDYGGIYAHTQFNTGFAGYPGGIASDLIYILEFYLATKTSPCSDIINKIEKLISFLELAQNDDWTFSYSLPITPTNEAQFYKCATGKKNITIGGAAAAAYAYYLYYSLTKNSKYLKLTENTISAILPEKDYFYFESFGFLRDAGINETDGVSPYYLIKTLKALILNENLEYHNYLKLLSAYIFQWHYNYQIPQTENFDIINLSVSPLTDSFEPRIAVWDILLWADMYLDIYDILKDKKYLDLAQFCFKKAQFWQNQISGGIPESIGINYDYSLTPININNGVSAWIILIAQRLLKILYNDDYKLKTKNTSAEYLVVEYRIKYTQIKFKKIFKNIMRYIPKNIKSAIKKILRVFINYTKLDNENLTAASSSPTIENYKNQYFTEISKKSKLLKYQKNSDIELFVSKKNRDVLVLYAPIIKFLNADNLRLINIEYIGKCIKQIELCADTNKKIIIKFNYGFPVNYHIHKNSVFFDYTPKLRTNENFVIKQNFEIIC